MKIYIRYVFFQTLKIFLLALSATTLGLVFFFVVEASIKRGLPFDLAFKMTPFILPDVLSKTLPIASLLSVTLFFSRMSGFNEIIALKALGIAPWRILLPVWALMFGVSLSSVWLNDLSTSWSRQQMTRVLLEGFETTILSQLREEKRFATPNGKYVVEASDVAEDGTLINPSFSGKGGEIGGVAETARLEVDFNAEEPVVKILLKNTEIETGGGKAVLPSSFNLAIPLNEFFRSSYRIDPPASKIKKTLDDLEAQREERRRQMATFAIFSFLRGNVDETSKRYWKDRPDFERSLDKQRNRYRLTIPRVWAAGFSCFFFAWVGAPFAIWFNKTDYTAAFFACFLPVLIVYYPLFMFGLEGAKSGVVSPHFAWLGNVALAFVGFWFLKKIH